MPPRKKPKASLQFIFGRNVRAARLAMGLTQKELGDAVGLQATYVSKVELGEKNLTLATMELLATSLNKEVFELLLR